jgi:hypothetical protein
MNRFDRIPSQTGQFGDILDGRDPTKINDKAFQRAGVMLFRLCEGQVGLPDTATIVTVEPGDIDHPFDLVMPDRKHLEDLWFLTEPDDPARSTTRTLQGVGMDVEIIEKNQSLF